MKTILLTIILTLAANISLASSTAGGYPACVSKEYFNQFTDAINNVDENSYNYLISNVKCIITKPDVPITVLNRGFGWSHVRAYSKKGIAIELWTNSENIKNNE